jgi:hypothetical protein
MKACIQMLAWVAIASAAEAAYFAACWNGVFGP